MNNLGVSCVWRLALLAVLIAPFVACKLSEDPARQPSSDAERLAAARQINEKGVGNEKRIDFEQASQYLKEIPTTAPESKEAQDLLKQVEEKLKLIDEIGEFPGAISGGGGCFPAFVIDYSLKQSLRDPDSLEYAQCSAIEVATYRGGRYWAQDVVYRAKNGFGGMNRVHNRFLIKHDLIVKVLDK